VEFAAQVGQALGEQGPEMRERRRWAAEQEGWSSRAQQLLAILEGQSKSTDAS